MATTDFGEINRFIDAAVVASLRPPPHLDRTRPLIPVPGSGFMTSAHYDTHFCDEVQSGYEQASGNTLVLSSKWRTTHKVDSVEVFIAEATIVAFNQANRIHVA